MNKNFSAVSIVLLVVGAIGGYWYGSSKSYDKGYQAAVTDVKATNRKCRPTKRRKKYQSTNPFQVSNPLEGVKANPFDKVKTLLIRLPNKNWKK